MSSKIENIADTALWVAHYRAVESERPDAIFHDHFAKPLAGERGRKIAESMPATARYTAWTLAIRTFMIDQYIENLIANGIDTVVNLGAGLDARPYRMSIPESLQWFEVDYPHVIEHKEKILAGEKPLCRLERIKLELADRVKRREMFRDLASRCEDVLILTEGVVPYLTEPQVAELAEDLRAHSQFRYWLADYFSPMTYRYLKNPKRMRALVNTPFRFFPENWLGVFEKAGWEKLDLKFLGEESLKLNRKPPRPWWFIFVKPFLNAKARTGFLRSSGYVLLTPKQTNA